MGSLQEEGACVMKVPAAGKESEDNELEKEKEDCSWDGFIARYGSTKIRSAWKSEARSWFRQG